MTRINKFIKAAEQDWSMERPVAGQYLFQRHGHTPGDGYPSEVRVTTTASGEVLHGVAVNGYDPYGDDDTYELKSRNLLAILTNVHNPFRYKLFHEAFLGSSPASTSEKIIAGRIKESERQIRNARILGHMSGYLADKLCIVVLGKHPMELYGFEAWCQYESQHAWPQPRKPRAEAKPEVEQEAL